MQAFRVQILATGSELTSGDRQESNAHWLAGELSRLGARVVGIHILPDDPELLLQYLQGIKASSEAELLFITGGLGPTADDHTVDLLSRFTGLEILKDANSLKKIRKLVKRRGLERLLPEIERQARVLKGAHVLKNSMGLAPGLFIKIPSLPFVIVALPGVPEEMRRMFAEESLPALEQEGFFQKRALFRRQLFLYDLTELELQKALQSEGIELANWGVSSSTGYLKLFLEKESPKALAGMVSHLQSHFPGQVFHKTIVEVLHDFLLEKGLSLALAESCTGGLVAKLITELPGASAYFLGGIVSYANTAKISVLGVEKKTIEKHGAVSEACALEMARGALRALGADVALSITGIAGPSGGDAKKPVGTVYIGLAAKDGRGGRSQVHHLTHHSKNDPQDRGRIRQSSAWHGLYYLYRFLGRP